MTINNAKRDENYIPVALGLNDDGTGTVQEMKVDPITGRLLVAIYIVASSTSTAPRSGAAFDENHIATATGVTDDVSLTPKAMVVDHRNGYLYVDLIQA